MIARERPNSNYQEVQQDNVRTHPWVRVCVYMYAQVTVYAWVHMHWWAGQEIATAVDDKTGGEMKVYSYKYTNIH